MLAALDIIPNRRTANAEASAARLRQHRVTGLRGLGNQESGNSLSSGSALAPSHAFAGRRRCATSIRSKLLHPRRLRSHDFISFGLREGK